MCHPGWARALAQEQRLKDLARLRRARDRIDREYAQPLDVAALAHEVNWPAGHLSRQFRLAYGRSPYAFVTARRVERAKTLLRDGDLTVTEVGFLVGFPSQGVFRARFTELAGLTPGAYRRGAAAAATRTQSGPVRNGEAFPTAPQLA
ncbi:MULTISPECIES: helix-turn-helix transcriptional regulator [unclassified Streptomyces]|uniref:helix-turn-helix transcriptional regulator n=1 Tax=unclassified Streptomyces TaxID=2593676 RepID=UPI0036EC9232